VVSDVSPGAGAESASRELADRASSCQQSLERMNCIKPSREGRAERSGLEEHAEKESGRALTRVRLPNSLRSSNAVLGSLFWQCAPGSVVCSTTGQASSRLALSAPALGLTSLATAHHSSQARGLLCSRTRANVLSWRLSRRRSFLGSDGCYGLRARDGIAVLGWNELRIPIEGVPEFVAELAMRTPEVVAHR